MVIPPDGAAEPPPFFAFLRTEDAQTGFSIAQCCINAMKSACPVGNLSTFENKGGFPRGDIIPANITSEESCVAIEWWSTRPVRACGYLENGDEVPDYVPAEADLAPETAEAPAPANEDDEVQVPTPRANELPSVPSIPFTRVADNYCCLADTEECNLCRERCNEEQPPLGCDVPPGS